MVQNTLEIIIKANSTAAVKAIKQLDTAIGKTSSASAKGFDAIKAKWNALDAKLSSPGGWKIMMGAAGAAVGVLTTVGVTVKKLADDFMNYAFQVEDFGRKIGATPEEASKLIQVADDIRLSVESMTVAMKTAISKGYDPNIEDLKKLSDEYLAIQNPIDRTRFAMDVFGTRAGPEMAKLLELGSDAIDKMGKSIEGTGRLMTTDGIAKAKAYYTALDNLGDAATSATLTIGSELTPVITGLAEGLTTTVDDGMGVVKMFTAMQAAMEAGAADLYDVQYALVDYMLVNKNAAEITAEFTNKAQSATGVYWSFTDSLMRGKEALTQTSTELAKVSEAAGKSASDLARMAGETAKIKNVEIGLEFTIPDVAAQMDNLITSIDWNAAGGAALSKFMEGFAGRVAPFTDEQKKAIARQVGAVDIALAIKTENITNVEGITQIKDLFESAGGISTSAAQNLIDKINSLSPPDLSNYLNQIMQLGSVEFTGAAAEQTGALNTQTQNLGETTGKLLESLTAWKDNVGELKENAKYGAQYTENLNRQIAALPKKVTLIVDIITNGSLPDLGDNYTGPGGNKPGPRVPGKKGATGLDMIVPPGYRSDNYPIYATSGERVLIQTPAQQKNEKTVNISNVFNIAANAPINVRELARQVVREQQRAGVT